MPLFLGPLQAITNAPDCYDYRWMKTVVDNIAVDEKGRMCRLVENEDQWHFDQQILRYHSGLHLTITDQQQLDDFLRHGWLKLTDDPVVVHRIKVDLHEATDWEQSRLTALLECIDEWRDSQDTSYITQHMTYLFECRSDETAERIRSQLTEFGLTIETWGPEFVPAESTRHG